MQMAAIIFCHAINIFSDSLALPDTNLCSLVIRLDNLPTVDVWRQNGQG